MKRKLTQRLIDNMPTPERGELCYYDSEVTGLLCRARPNGSKAWMLRFKVAGRERKFSIGNAKIGKLDSAREVAKQHLWSVATGEDPLEQARLSKALKSMTVTDLGEEVLDHLAAQGRSAKYIADYRRLLTKVIHPAIGDQGVKEVTTRDLDRLVRRMATTPRTGNVLRSLLSRMFILAVTWGYRPDNPALGIEKFSERARERVLTDEELDCLISALDASPSQTSADVVRLLLFTGSRGGEVLGATWGQFQLEEGVWIKPSQHTKTKRAHRVELGPDALLVLRRMELARDTSSPFLFPSASRCGHLTTIATFWRLLMRRAGLEGIRGHDLRRTVLTRLLGQGIEWLNRHPETSQPDRCAWCAKPGTECTIVPFLAGDGGHTWLHPECWEAWHQDRRRKAGHAHPLETL